MDRDEGHGFVVATRALTKTYGDFTAVEALDLQVSRGGVYGFLGPNGAGKSTTMKLLLGLTRPTSGQLWVLGQEVTGHGAVRPGAVGPLIEGPAFYPSLSGRENLQMVASYLQLPAGSVDQALGTVGLDAASSKQVKHYSLGMKQRLGLAMALVSQPQLLLLDEPTNGLDPAGVAEIRRLIVNLSRQEGVTVIEGAGGGVPAVEECVSFALGDGVDPQLLDRHGASFGVRS